MNSLTRTTIRQAAVAGMFYPGHREELGRELDELFEDARAHPAAPAEGALHALIVPHAGYLYSGPTAARAYALVQGGGFETCILVGPSHREYFRGVSVYPGAAYATPLGVCTIDDACREELLAQSTVIRTALEGHRDEHSLEVQVPFLQRVLPQAMIVPMIMGDQEADTCRALGEAIARVAQGKNILLVASSDLSHFYPSDVARTKDREVISLIEAFNVSGLLQQLEADTCEACGGGPIAAVMTAAERSGAAHATIVHACNSGDVTGDRSRVVGYCSAALWKTP
jgi:MEMO1 family protein